MQKSPRLLCVKAIIYLLYNLHDGITFNMFIKLDLGGSEDPRDTQFFKSCSTYLNFRYNIKSARFCFLIC